MRSRQRVLTERGPAARDLDAFEAVMATEGARHALARRRAAERVVEELGHSFVRLAAQGTPVIARYAPGGSEDAAEFRQRLERGRDVDARRGSSSFGPHRDELELTLLGRPARTHASQGQQRLLALALKLAELECVREARGADPILLLDDVSSELDPERTRAVHDLVLGNRGQVFVTTTRLDLFPTGTFAPAERADFRLVRGALAERPGVPPKTP
jgi:DNA replication and repair protein RecF